MSIRNTFAISEDDIIEVLREEDHTQDHGWEQDLEGLFNDDDMTRWMNDLDHDIIADAALYFDDIDEQTDAARAAISEQLKHNGVYDELDARFSQKQMQEKTPGSLPAPPILRP